jgi:3-oxoacyl-[acyl-carrier protein] reductase
MRSTTSSPKRASGWGVHLLVNNAGVTHDGALWRLTAEAWQEVLDTNVTGAFNCMHAVSPHLRAQRYGKIVNISSHQAFRPDSGSRITPPARRR